ncbi:MAG: zinc ribbon domain-containing protein [Myxococcota bacterium]
MEFRCEHCSHVGEPEKVEPSPSGLLLVCANCGQENSLDVGGDPTTEHDRDGERTPESAGREAQDADASLEDAPTATADDLARVTGVNLENLRVDDATRARGFGSNEDVRSYLRKDALEAMIPEPGPGPRCPKCAKKLDPDVENCARCGLNQREAMSYDEGEAPWEQPPPGKEAEYDQARLLWGALEDDWSEERLENFVDFITEAELLDIGIRRLRFHLIDHPDDELAREYLEDLAESLQSRLIIAQVQAQASADEFQDEVSRFKTRMVTVALLFWGGIFLLFLAFFWDNCSQAL